MCKRAGAGPLSGWWWADDPALSAVETEYGPVVAGTDPTEVFIVVIAGREAGLIQRYRFDEEPSYAGETGPAAVVLSLIHISDPTRTY